jgi:hypothetical protein
MHTMLLEVVHTHGPNPAHHTNTVKIITFAKETCVVKSPCHKPFGAETRACVKLSGADNPADDAAAQVPAPGAQHTL